MKKVSLLNGGTITVDIEAATYQGQTFVRLSPCIVVGLVTGTKGRTKRCDHIYLWRKVGVGASAVYCYLGDVSLYAHKDTGTATSFGFALSKELSPHLKKKALARQKMLAEDVDICCKAGSVFNSISAVSGILCHPAPR